MIGKPTGVSRKWTDAEDEFIKTTYKILKRRELAEIFGTSEQTVSLRAKKLGVQLRGPTPSEVDFILKNYETMNPKQIAEELGRNVRFIYTVAMKYKVRRYTQDDSINSHAPWMKEEDEYVDSNTGRVSMDVIAKRLGRTEEAVRSRLKRRANG